MFIELLLAAKYFTEFKRQKNICVLKQQNKVLSKQTIVSFASNIDLFINSHNIFFWLDRSFCLANTKRN